MKELKKYILENFGELVEDKDNYELQGDSWLMSFTFYEEDAPIEGFTLVLSISVTVEEVEGDMSVGEPMYYKDYHVEVRNINLIDDETGDVEKFDELPVTKYLDLEGLYEEYLEYPK